MIDKISIVYNSNRDISKELQSLLEYIKTQYSVEIVLLDYRQIIGEADRYKLSLLYLNDNEIKIFLKNHLNSSIKVGFIPNKECIRALNCYGISKDSYKAIADAMDSENLSCVDMLTCNGEIVFTNVIVGDVHGLSYKNIEKQTIFSKIKSFYYNLKNLSFKDYTLSTAKEQVIHTAATGIMVLGHNSQFGKSHIINEDLSFYNGKLNAFIISPTSIFSYIYYLLIVTFYAKFNTNELPKTLGLIKSSKLNITSTRPMDFTVDSVFMSAKEIQLEVFNRSLNISIGNDIIEALKNINTIDDNPDKEIIKTNHLPKEEVKNLLIKESVPLFKKANEDDFKELFLSLKKNSKLNPPYIVLMVLSTLLATTGLFQNSAPVIIGAMILAPLMSPIISFSMGIARGESSLMSNSLKTLGFGIITALIFSCIYTYLMPLDVLTHEMRSRLNPNILDLMVAIISGIAGSYASAKSDIAKSLAGVAIAVALVPPLSVTGIGLGWGNLDITYGSFLLFLTNLVGITLAASITFLVLGYSPIHRAKKGIIYTFSILMIVAVPLIISFDKAITQNQIMSKLNNLTFKENNKTISIQILHVDLSKNEPEIFLQTNSNEVLNKEDLKLLKKEIEQLINENVVLNTSINTIVD